MSNSKPFSDPRQGTAVESIASPSGVWDLPYLDAFWSLSEDGRRQVVARLAATDRDLAYWPEEEREQFERDVVLEERPSFPDRVARWVEILGGRMLWFLREDRDFRAERERIEAEVRLLTLWVWRHATEGAGDEAERQVRVLRKQAQEEVERLLGPKWF